MKCSVFLAQIRGEEGLAAPCPRQRWLTVPFGDEGSCYPSARWQGAKESPASSAGSVERAGHPPSAMGAVSHLEERIPPLPLQGCFAYAPLGKEEFYCGCTEELSQEVALWLVDPSVERQASQMQHIAKPGSSVEHCCSAEQGSENELKSFFF